jgi:hypothetical protein
MTGSFDEAALIPNGADQNAFQIRSETRSFELSLELADMSAETLERSRVAAPYHPLLVIPWRTTAARYPFEFSVGEPLPKRGCAQLLTRFGELLEQFFVSEFLDL